MIMEETVMIKISSLRFKHAFFKSTPLSPIHVDLHTFISIAKMTNLNGLLVGKITEY